MWYFSLSILIFCSFAGGRQPTRWAKLLNDISNSSQQSIGEYARQKIANLHLLRDKLEQKSRLTEQEDKTTNKNSYLVPNNASTNSIKSTPWGNGYSPALFDKFHSENLKNASIITSLSEMRKDQLGVTWNGFTSIFGSKSSRDSLLSKLIPRTEMLKKLIKIRGKMNPGLRSYLTAKYNLMLTNLIPFSDSLGVPSSVINSMKLNTNAESRWNLIESLLDHSNVDQFLRSLPEFSNFPSDNSLSIQSRSDDQDTFVKSDQEPDATSKGHKKYPNLDISQSSRRTRLRKGEIVTPDRTGYEQGFDQYGLYGHDSYDTTSYGKGYDDYYSLKSYGKGHGGGNSGSTSQRHNHKGYGGYDDNYQSGSSYKGSYGTAKGHGGYGGGGGYGGSGGSYGGNGIMDPFSILGGLAFLTYLGLLLQQSLNRNNTGRAFPNYDTYLIGSRNAYRQQVQLTQLPLRANTNYDARVHARNLRSVKHPTVQNVIHELEYIWNQIEELERIGSLYCRHLKLCQLVDYIGKKPHLLDVFKEALEFRKADTEFVEQLLNRKMRGSKLSCKYDVICAG